MVRALLFLIPLLTLLVPKRFFGFYAALMFAVVGYVVLMFTLLREETNQALASFGVEVAAGYLALNLVLLGVRYALLRRARASE